MGSVYLVTQMCYPSALLDWKKKADNSLAKDVCKKSPKNSNPYEEGLSK